MRRFAFSFTSGASPSGPPMTKTTREDSLIHSLSARLGKPEEVAGLAAFLLSDEAGYITRAVIPVSGGIF